MNKTNQKKVNLALKMSDESRKRMNGYSHEKRAELEIKARAIIAKGEMNNK